MFDLFRTKKKDEVLQPIIECKSEPFVMPEIDGFVISYLQKYPTSYAVMISGAWGSGKTFYWKNRLKNVVANTLLPDALSSECDENGQRKKYKPVYVSLYGVKSIEALNKKLFFAKYQEYAMLDSQTFKLIGEAAKSVMSVVESVGPLGKFITNIRMPSVDYGKMLDFKDTVLCFDDFERSELALEEIMSYINNFVEADGTKTIIMSNEKEVNGYTKNIEQKILCAFESMPKSEEKTKDISLLRERIKLIFDPFDRYKVIKEKTIAFTICFEPDFKQVMHSIVRHISKDNSDHLLLEKQMPVIQAVLKRSNANVNFRIIMLTLVDFLTVIKKGKAANVEFTENEIEDILWLLLAVKIEIMNAQVLLPKDSCEKAEKEASPDKKISIDTFSRISQSIDAGTFSGAIYSSIFRLDNKGQLSESDLFIYRYYDSEARGRVIYSSIITFALKGYVDDVCLKAEFARVEPAQIPQHEKALSQIIGAYWEMEQSVFDEAVKIVISSAKEGKYRLAQYPSLFSKLMLLLDSNLIANETKESIKNIVDEGMKKAFAVGIYDPRFNTDLFFLEKKTDELNLIISSAIAFNKRLLCQENQKRLNDFISNLPEKLDDFGHEISTLTERLETEPIFQIIDLEELADKVMNMDSKTTIKLMNYIVQRYRYSNVLETNLVRDKEGIVSFESILSKKISETKLDLLNANSKKVLCESLLSISKSLTSTERKEL